MAFRHPGEELDSLPDDWARYQWCRTRMEKARNEWFEGRLREIDKLKRNGDRWVSPEIVGKIRWGSSGLAKDLVSREQMYERWALFYLQTWSSTRGTS